MRLRLRLVGARACKKQTINLSNVCLGAERRQHALYALVRHKTQSRTHGSISISRLHGECASHCTNTYYALSSKTNVLIAVKIKFTPRTSSKPAASS
ncbi:hypothetical protein PoB_002942100 [Plakobranchus ocellatus]|uniref:Uncharacterized protein n=1 Tax=Plakobranchus ocellatus TaxID=259542 RepID=A0AAV4A3Y8_9GAST|nr:hypothetical protein PoB_002942100 [Plakobranchus ocellatus]